MGIKCKTYVKFSDGKIRLQRKCVCGQHVPSGVGPLPGVWRFAFAERPEPPRAHQEAELLFTALPSQQVHGLALGVLYLVQKFKKD